MTGKMPIAILSIAVVLFAATAFVVFNDNGQTSDDGAEASPEVIEISERSSYYIEKLGDSYQVVKKDGTLRAYVSGEKELPIVVVKGDTHSAELATSKASTMSSYFNWVANNVTDGIPGYMNLDFGCTALCVDDGTNLYVGRNLDWSGFSAPLVVKCIPDNGYASIGISAKCSVFSDSTSISSMAKNYKLASTPYFVTEGMNEKGLTVSMLTVEYTSATATKTGGLFAMGMIRYLLDYAADIDEAINLVNTVGFSNSLYDSYKETAHLFVTDSTGRSVALECINGTLYVTETDYIANHYVKSGTGARIYEDSIVRYDAMVERMSQSDELSINKVKEALDAGQGISPWDSIWSIVFDPKNLTLNVWYHENFDCDAVVYDIKELIQDRDVDTVRPI